MYPPNLNVPLPDPSPLVPEQTARPAEPAGIERILPIITSLFGMGTALGGSPRAGAAFLQGAHQSLTQRQQQRKQEADQQQRQAYQQQQLAAQEQYRQQQAAAQRAKNIQDLITGTAKSLEGVTDRDQYEQTMGMAESFAGELYQLRPNTIRALVPYHAPNADKVMATAGDKWLKNPLNAGNIDAGNFDGVIAVDVQGDGKPINVPVRDVLKKTGASFDPETGGLLTVQKAAKPSGIQLDDEAFLGEVAKFEAEKGRKATPSERGAIALKVRKEIAAAGRAAGGADGGLKDYQKFTAGEKLADKWTKTNTSIKEMNRQFGLMQTGLNRFKQGDKLGGSQAVLVTFQKILDPTSVVRESEYARSASGLSLLSQLEGYAERLSQGGAGVPLSDLAGMVETARQMLSSMQAYTNGQRKRIGAAASQYGIDPALVFDDLTPDDPGAAPDQTGGPVVGSIVTLKDGRRVKVSGMNPDGSVKGTIVR